MLRKRRSPSIEVLRERIDRADAQLLRLLNRRARLAVRIGRAKAHDGAATYVPERERRIVARLATLNSGPLSDHAIQSIYREIISASRALEAPLRVAYLGPEATYAHMAAREQFGSVAEFVPAPTIPHVFSEVERGQVDYGVVPVENSSEGSVAITLDLLVESQLLIIAERSLEIRHCLLSRTTTLSRLKRVVSHPQSLAQCRRWLATNLPQAETEAASSNSRAAELVRADPRAAAIAGRLAGDRYGLHVVAENIQDQAANFTRFAVLGRSPQPSQSSGHDKTSLVLSVRDEVGVLSSIVKPFADNALNLLRIESRPLKGRPWEYLFFIDVAGHMSETPLAQTLKQIEAHCVFVKVLGSYSTGASRHR